MAPNRRHRERYQALAAAKKATGGTPQAALPLDRSACSTRLSLATAARSGKRSSRSAAFWSVLAGNRAASRRRSSTETRPRRSAPSPLIAALRAAESNAVRSCEQALPNGEHEQRVKRRDNVIGHHTEAIVPFAIDQLGGRWLDDVEKAEQRKCQCLAQGLGTNEEQHQQERHDFIPNNAAVVGHAEIAPGTIRRPDAHSKGEDAGQEIADIVGIDAQQRGQRQRDQRAHRAGRDGTQAGAEAQGDEVRGMRDEEAERGCRGHRWLSWRSDRINAAAWSSVLPFHCEQSGLAVRR